MAEFFVPNKQKLRRLERLEVEPRDFNETVSFWRRLGFKVTIQGTPGQRGAALKAGELRLRFQENEDRSLDRRRSAFVALRLVFSVREFDEYLESLRQKGIEVPEPARHPGFPPAAEVIDPNGIRILIESDAG